MITASAIEGLITGRLYGAPPVSEQDKTYVIVDGAKLRSAYTNLQSHHPAYRILYAGAVADHYEQEAPYLIELDTHPDFAQLLVRVGIHEDCLLFLKSRADIDTLARHFRNYTVVYIEPLRKKAFYAFYDPRITRFHFEHLSTAEIRAFMQPLSSIAYCVSSEPDRLYCYYPQDKEPAWQCQVQALVMET